MSGIDSVHKSENLTLKCALLIPNLAYNPLSISKLEKDLNHVTHFLNHVTHFHAGGCEFQNLELKMISNAKDCAASTFSMELKRKLLLLVIFEAKLWHCSMGHSNLQIGKLCFPISSIKTPLFQPWRRSSPNRPAY